MSLLALAVGGRGLVDPDEPVLHVDDEAFLRSRAAFETTRVYGGRPFKLIEHLARLAGSAERVEIGRIDTEELARLAALAVEAAGAPDAMLRLFVTPGRNGAGNPTQVAMVSTLPEGLDEVRARGIKLVSIQLGLDPELRASAPWLLGGVKSTSYAVNMAAEAEAKRRGADDAVFLGSGDIVLEGPVTNIWWRDDDVLYTPALELGILAGVTQGDAPRGGRRRGVRGARRRLPARPRGRGERGLHVLVHPRGDAGRRARRKADRRWSARARGPGAPGSAAPSGAALRIKR